MNTRYVLLALFLFGVAEVRPQVVVIAHRAVPVTAVDATFLRDVYTIAVTEWNDGTPITLYVMKGESGTAAAFFRAVGMQPLQLRKLWLRMKLTGEGRAPIAVSSEEEMIQRVAATPGGIGYVAPGRTVGEAKVLLAAGE